MTSQKITDKGPAASRFTLPDGPSLRRGLGRVLQPESGDVPELLDRRLHSRASTFPLEIVKCRLHSGRVVDVVCKYSGEQRSGRHEHKGGVRYEASVYREFLDSCGMPVAGFRGSYRDTDTDWDWLVLDYLDNASYSGEVENGLACAAAWLGKFHAFHEGNARSQSTLRSFDVAYFEGWANRTIEWTKSSAPGYPWLRPLCEKYRETVPRLLDSPTTVIHGEFYSKNILIVDDEAYPVDWEFAAVGPGVIDIASITEKWPEPVVQECLIRYCESRWPDGAPDDFPQHLEIARLYWLLRWVGDVRHKALRRLARRISRLETFARAWGILTE